MFRYYSRQVALYPIRIFFVLYWRIIYLRGVIVQAVLKSKDAVLLLHKGCLNEIIVDLPRHSSFSYINQDSLAADYFQNACTALNNGYVYIVITQSKSAASEMIGLFTNKQYNHVSLAFDPELHTLISYNGGHNVNQPGLNPESLQQITVNDGSSVMVYRLPATSEQKQIMLDIIQQINFNGSAYNILGLLFKFSYQPNIMFCSQFVYSLLKSADLQYFEKPAVSVKPSDFVELDYYRNLEFVQELHVNKSA